MGFRFPFTSRPAASSARAATSERGILFTLAAVQFTHIMDFMIMMPLGAGLMRVFNITPTQFSYLVAAYGLAAAITGFAGGFFMDRLDRKHALLWLYAGFGVATLACAFAPTFHLLLAARIAAGACGGVAGAIVLAIVADVIPPDRRGRGMAVVMTSFPLASVVGVPTGLVLVDLFEWHAPFLMLAGLSVPIWCVASRFLPALPPSPIKAHPGRQMWEILTHGVHLRGFLLTASLVFAGGLVIPFMAPSLVANTGLKESQLKFVYLCGGAATFFTTPLFGRLADRHDKLNVLAGITVLAIATVLVLTRLGPSPVVLTLVVATVFFRDDVRSLHSDDGHDQQRDRTPLPRRIHERKLCGATSGQRRRQPRGRRAHHARSLGPTRRLSTRRLVCRICLCTDRRARLAPALRRPACGQTGSRPNLRFIRDRLRRTASRSPLRLPATVARLR